MKTKNAMKLQENNLIILSSYCNGHNFGSILQCFALKKYLENNEYQVVVIDEKNRFKKVMITFFRGLFHPNFLINVIKASRKTRNNISLKQHELFNKDILNLGIKTLTFFEAKKYASDALCCICGSDQIWNTEKLYFNKFYYLSFSPFSKNISFAPSLGRNYLPKFNEKIIKKLVKNIRFLSTREEDNCSLLANLSIGSHVVSVCDPVFLLSKSEWMKLSENDICKTKNCVVCYFLDIPQKFILNEILITLKTIGKRVIFLGNALKQYSSLFDFEHKFIEINSMSFPKLVFDSFCVLTDSFHGIAFSILGDIKVYWFPRNYISGKSQDIRILSLLKTFSIRHTSKYELVRNEDSEKLIMNVVSFSKAYLLSCIEVIKSE